MPQMTYEELSNKADAIWDEMEKAWRAKDFKTYKRLELEWRDTDRAMSTYNRDKLNEALDGLERALEETWLGKQCIRLLDWVDAKLTNRKGMKK